MFGSGHNLSIIQDRRPLQPSVIRPAPSPGPSGDTGAISRPLAVRPPHSLPLCPVPFSVPRSSPLACPRCSLCGAWIQEDWTVESCSRNCHLVLLFITQQHLQVQLRTNFCLCIQNGLQCCCLPSISLALYKFPGTNMSRSGGIMAT